MSTKLSFIPRFSPLEVRPFFTHPNQLIDCLKNTQSSKIKIVEYRIVSKQYAVTLLTMDERKGSSNESSIHFKTAEETTMIG